MAAAAAAACVLLASRLAAPVGAGDGVRLALDEARRRVDGLVDGRPFTSYLFSFWNNSDARPAGVQARMRFQDEAR